MDNVYTIFVFIFSRLKNNTNSSDKKIQNISNTSIIEYDRTQISKQKFLKT